MNAKPQIADSEKAKALQAALAQIEKQFGKGTIMRLGEGEVIDDIQVVSTGSLGLDVALGVGGLPRGRVIEIYGPESSGKTTLTLQVVAEMQKAVDSANGEIARVDSLLDQAEVIGTRVEATSRLAWIAMRNPLVKLASVSLISARRKRRRDPVIDTQVVLEQLDQPTMVRTEPIALSSRRKRQRRAS